MHKNINTAVHDIDALLRHTACQDNAALPWEDWQTNLLAAAENNITEQTAAILLPFTATLPARQNHTIQKKRRIIVGFSTAAAALLLLFGLRTFTPNMSSAPAPAAPAPFLIAPQSAPDTGVAQDSALPETSMIEEPEMEKGTGGSDAENETNNVCGAPLAPPGYEGNSLTEAELAALQAVYEALDMRLADISAEELAQYALVSRVERANVTLLPLGGEGGERQLQDGMIYAVILDTREPDAPVYAVDVTTLSVLGVMRGGL